MMMRNALWTAGFLFFAACQAPPPAPEPAAPAAPAVAPAAETEAAPEADALVNTVWVRSDEGGPLGEMRIFLAGGTLVQDSCWEVYALRSWRRTSPEEIVMVEDTVEIPARIVALGPDELRLSLSLVDGSRQEIAYKKGTAPYVCPEMKK
jgi:hypothetical protein